MPNPDLFVYHAPNSDTAPRYKAIADAWGRCHRILDRVMENFVAIEPPAVPTPDAYAEVNAACKAFYDVIQKVCPPSADRSAAERCVRLARMKANEAMCPMHENCTADLPGKLGEAALMELLNAKHQAAASIALALPHELPAWEG